jgi:hypothetical protein
VTGSAVLAVTAWGIFIGWLAYELRRDSAEWRRTQKRGRTRTVPPRPAQTRDWAWPVARSVEELDALYERSHDEPGRLA